MSVLISVSIVMAISQYSNLNHACAIASKLARTLTETLHSSPVPGSAAELLYSPFSGCSGGIIDIQRICVNSFLCM